MQQDKFDQAAACIQMPKSPSKRVVTSTHIVQSPLNERYGTTAYWKKKCESAVDVISMLSDSSIDLENIPGLLKVNKITPKQSKENVRVTQVQGSMEGKKILERVSEIKKEKEKKEAAKEKAKQETQNRISMFHQCKNGCICNNTPCQAKGLQECSRCHNILRSVCSRTKCKGEDGSKPLMIKQAVPNGTKSRRLKFDNSDDNDESSSEEDNLMLSSEEESEEDGEEREEEQGEVIATGDYVKIVSGAYLGYYAIVTGESYGEELEIQYFEKKEKWWVLKEHDLDSRPQTELRRVTKARVDRRMHFFK